MSDDRLDRIESKIDKIVEHIGSVDVTLAKQEVSLAEHIRRTALIEDKLKPVESHVHMVNGAFKLVGLLSTVAGILTVLWKVFK
jgi:hypothetical protein